MLNQRWSLVLLIPLALHGAAAADAPTTRKTDPQAVADLLRTATGADAAARARAQQELADSESQRQHALEILRQAKAAAEAARTRIAGDQLDSMTRVTVELTNATLPDALNRLRESAGVGFHWTDPGEWPDGKAPSITLAARDQPFLQVLREICVQANMTPIWFHEELGFTFTSLDYMPIWRLDPAIQTSNAFQSPSSAHGPFMVMLPAVHRTETSALKLDLVVVTDPQIRFAQVFVEPVIEEAVDQDGRPLKLKSMGPDWKTVYGNCFSQSIQFEGAGRLERLARLKGYFKAKVSRGSQRIEIDEPLKKLRVPHRVGNYTVTLLGLTALEGEREGQYSVALRSKLDAGATDQQRPVFAIVDAKKQPYLPPGGHRWWLQGAFGAMDRRVHPNNDVDQATVFAMPKDGGPPASVIVVALTPPIEVKIPFEFTNVPLRQPSPAGAAAVPAVRPGPVLTRGEAYQDQLWAPEREAKLKQSPLPPPTLLKLKLTNATPQAAVEEIARHMKAPLRTPDNLWHWVERNKVNIDVDGQPWFEVMSQLHQQGQVRPDPSEHVEFASPMSNQDGAVEPIRITTDYSKNKRPFMVSGPFAVELGEAKASVTVRLDGKPHPARLHVNGLIMREPGMPAWAFRRAAVVREAVDDLGNATAGIEVDPTGPVIPSVPGNVPRGMGQAAHFTLVLGYPSDHARTMRVRGEVPVVLRGPLVHAEIPGFSAADPEPVKLDGIAIRIRNFKKELNGFGFECVIDSRDSADAALRLLFPWRQFTLTDAQGTVFEGGVPRRQVEVADRSGRQPEPSPEMVYKVNFMRGKTKGPPKTLSVTIPTELREVRVPFQFEVPLP